MSEGPLTSAEMDVGAYCRHVEDFLATVNEGHLVRIVGPAFELVRGWALEGIPLSLVCDGIRLKAERAERQRAGRTRRALRLEFCEADVRAAYEQWRHAVGLGSAGPGAAEAPDAADRPARRPSLAQAVDRAIERIARVAGRLDLPSSFREALDACVEDLGAIRLAAKSARGADRAPLLARAAIVDQRMIAAAREAAGPEVIETARAAAQRDLSSYRDRFSGEQWARSVAACVDRTLRSHFGLPTLSDLS